MAQNADSNAADSDTADSDTLAQNAALRRALGGVQDTTFMSWKVCQCEDLSVSAVITQHSPCYHTPVDYVPLLSHSC